MGIARREVIRLGALGVLSLALAAGSYLYGHSLIKAISKRDYPFATGLDFTSYEPAIHVNGTSLETVMRWESNTRASDIAKWGTSMMARMIAFRPYLGHYALPFDGELAEAGSSPLPLDEIIREGAKHISALSHAFDREIGERTLMVNPGLEQELYHPSLWAKAAKETQGTAVSYFVSKALDAAIVAHKEKRNTAFELDKPAALSFETFASHLGAVVAAKEAYDSELPIIAGLNGAELINGAFEAQYRAGIFKAVDAVLINIPSAMADTPLVDDTLGRVRQLIGAKKLYVRLHVSHYDNAQQAFTVLSPEALRPVLERIEKYADGSFIHDAYGMHLYRGLFGADRAPPMDGGALKALVRQWHQSNIALGET